MVSHALSHAVLILKVLYFGSYWGLAINMNFLIADVIWFVSGTMVTFSQGGAAKVKSKQFSDWLPDYYEKISIGSCERIVFPLHAFAKFQHQIIELCFLQHCSMFVLKLDILIQNLQRIDCSLTTSEEHVSLTHETEFTCKIL